MDSDSENAMTLVPDATPVAAYAMAGSGSIDNGVHCSRFPDDFCFFCAFERNPNATSNEKDLYSSISDMVQHMSSIKREPAAIADHVYKAYEDTVRHVVKGEPAWSKASILRHILYNGQFEDVFDTSVCNMLSSIIVRQNNTLVDGSTGNIIEENRKAFCDTVATLIKWKQSRRMKSKSGLAGKK
tara:strand:- start:7392 stop:7946 length:555 start_codon:yes stop_codon:yes gene_type:complete